LFGVYLYIFVKEVVILARIFLDYIYIIYL